MKGNQFALVFTGQTMLMWMPPKVRCYLKVFVAKWLGTNWDLDVCPKDLK